MAKSIIYLLTVINLVLIAFLIKIEFFSPNNFQESTITLKDSKGKTRLKLEGGDNPSLSILNEKGIPIALIKQHDQKHAQVVLSDEDGKSNIELMGGGMPALFIRNEQGEVIGTFLALEQGGTGIGLGDLKGNVSAFIRGGAQPSLNFFHQSNEPIVSVGITKSIPHLYLINNHGKEGVIMHGGSPASLLFINEEGKIPVVLSKHGLYQEKKPPPKPPEKPKDKVFSWKESN